MYLLEFIVASFSIIASLITIVSFRKKDKVIINKSIVETEQHNELINNGIMQNSHVIQNHINLGGFDTSKKDHFKQRTNFIHYLFSFIIATIFLTTFVTNFEILKLNTIDLDKITDHAFWFIALCAKLITYLLFALVFIRSVDIFVFKQLNSFSFFIKLREKILLVLVFIGTALQFFNLKSLNSFNTAATLLSHELTFYGVLEFFNYIISPLFTIIVFRSFGMTTLIRTNIGTNKESTEKNLLIGMVILIIFFGAFNFLLS